MGGVKAPLFFIFMFNLVHVDPNNNDVTVIEGRRLASLTEGKVSFNTPLEVKDIEILEIMSKLIFGTHYDLDKEKMKSFYVGKYCLFDQAYQVNICENCYLEFRQPEKKLKPKPKNPLLGV